MAQAFDVSGRRRRTFPSRKILLIILALLVVAGVGLYIRGSGGNDDNQSIQSTARPEYLNFEGNYTFKVPKTYAVDEQTIPGAQLVYSGQVTAKTLEDVYTAGGISLHPITDLTDHSGKAFKDYVNTNYLPERKKLLSTNDIKVEFDKQKNDQDVARLSAKKDGKEIRFIFLKGGQHPVAVTANHETEAFKEIEETLKDAEKSDLKNDVASLKQVIKTTAELIKGQKARDLYTSATPELREKNTEAELTNALKTAAAYTSGSITISGGGYTPNQFSAAIRFVKLDKNDQQPAIGSMVFKRIDGQWKLQALSLPTPRQ